MKAQHTPTPWNLNGRHIDAEKGNKLIVSLRSEHDAENLANAAFIVRACNSHDALVEALENAKAEIISEIDTNTSTNILLNEIDAVLAAAKGES